MNNHIRSVSDHSENSRVKPSSVKLTAAYEEVVTVPTFRDPTAGCNCGENCERKPYDPCPIAAMPVWEVTLPGWRGDTDKYDHLVKWIKCDTAEDVVRYLYRNHPGIVLNCDIWPIPLPPSLSFEDGLDLVLNGPEFWLGDMGDTKGGSLVEFVKKSTAERLQRYKEDIVVLCKRPRLITLAEHERSIGNSWEHELMISRLDDEALLSAAKNCLKNCAPAPSVTSTYDESMIHNYAPLMIERLEEALRYGKNKETNENRQDSKDTAAGAAD